MNKHKLINGVIFITLCLIWGSSFELMKLGMFEHHNPLLPVLTPYQVAAIRMLVSGLIMLPFAYKAIKQVPKDLLKFIVASGLLGSFFPAFLFCIAETKIGGGIAGSLNALTPLFVIIIGAFFFKLITTTQKIIGVVVGFCGSAVLIYANTQGQVINETQYIVFVIFATFLYGINVNMVIKKLSGVPSIQIAAIAFSALIIPSIILLVNTGYFSLQLSQSKYLVATTAASILGVFGTALASILFYTLMKRAGGIFASTVTYGIPFVAIGWGLIHQEHITLIHILGLIIILGGVYLAGKS